MKKDKTCEHCKHKECLKESIQNDLQHIEGTLNGFAGDEDIYVPAQSFEPTYFPFYFVSFVYLLSCYYYKMTLYKPFYQLRGRTHFGLYALILLNWVNFTVFRI